MVTRDVAPGEISDARSASRSRGVIVGELERSHESRGDVRDVQGIHEHDFGIVQRARRGSTGNNASSFVQRFHRRQAPSLGSRHVREHRRVAVETLQHCSRHEPEHDGVAEIDATPARRANDHEGTEISVTGERFGVRLAESLEILPRFASADVERERSLDTVLVKECANICLARWCCSIIVDAETNFVKPSRIEPVVHETSQNSGCCQYDAHVASALQEL